VFINYLGDSYNHIPSIMLVVKKYIIKNKFFFFKTYLFERDSKWGGEGEKESQVGEESAWDSLSLPLPVSPAKKKCVNLIKLYFALPTTLHWN